MLEHTPAIVIHSFPYSDSSIIAKTYCEKGGYTSFLAKGYRKGKKHKASLHPLASVEISYYNKGNTGLKLANKIELSNPHSSILFNPIKSGLAMFLAEWLSLTLNEDQEGDPRFFNWLNKAIEALNEVESVANFHIWFLIRLSDFLGISPQGRRSEKEAYFNYKEGVFSNNTNSDCFSTVESKLFDRILDLNLEESLNIALDKKERNQLLSMIRQYYQFHLSIAMELKSWDILTQIYNE